jgi:hypothetical protein
LQETFELSSHGDAASIVGHRLPACGIIRDITQVLTLLLTSVIFLTMHYFVPGRFAEELRHAADVSRVSRLLRMPRIGDDGLFISMTTGLLVVRLCWTVIDASSSPSAVQSDLAHLISFVLGVVLLRRLSSMRLLARTSARLQT